MSSSERKVHVQQNDNHLIDSEFNSIRTRFEDDMRKMEEEMNRFRSHLVDRERNFFGPALTTTTGASDASLLGRTSPGGASGGNWIETINSPLVQDTEDGKVLKLRFDVTQYAPEEIVVKTIDNRLQVHAKHEEKSDNRSVYREYNREFLLPKNTNPEMIRSSLSKDGVLTVEAPLPVPQLQEGEKRIPIQHK